MLSVKRWWARPERITRGRCSSMRAIPESYWLGRQDSNLQMRDPKSRGLAICRRPSRLFIVVARPPMCPACRVLIGLRATIRHGLGRGPDPGSDPGPWPQVGSKAKVDPGRLFGDAPSENLRRAGASVQDQGQGRGRCLGGTHARSAHSPSVLLRLLLGPVLLAQEAARDLLGT